MKTAVLDIGGTAIKAGIYENNTLGQIREFETNASLGGEHVVEKAITILKQYESFDRIGISTAGQVDSKQGMIRYANSNIPEYTGTQLKAIMEREFGVPAAVENDVNAAALGEAHFGAGKDYSNFLCLTYGTGIGGAIVINRELYRGDTFSAGEMGAILIHPEDRNAEEDMFSGCYEKYASTTALVLKAMEIDKTLTDGRKIFAALERSSVRMVVDNWITEVTYGLVSLIHIFNPGCVILGGGVMKQDYIIERIKQSLYQNIMESYHGVKLVQAGLGNQAGLFGAVYCAGR